MYRAWSPNSHFAKQKWEWPSNRKSLMAKAMSHYGRRMCSANKMFVLSDIKHTWDYHSNISPFANPGSGSVIIIVVWYLFELCVDIGAIEEWTLKTMVIHTTYTQHFFSSHIAQSPTGAAITLYKMNGHMVLFETFLIRWKSLCWSLWALEFEARSSSLPLRKMNIICSAMELGCLPLKLFKFHFRFSAQPKLGH